MEIGVMKNLWIQSLIAVVLLYSVSAQAGLILRDINGVKMVYDRDQDLTWLLDTNYAKTSGYNDSGLLNWEDALAWTDSLSIAGYSDWRLPTITGQLSCNGTFSYVDGGFCGFNSNTDVSEFSYMYYVHLQNKGKVDTDGNIYPDWNDSDLAANLNTTFTDFQTGETVSFENMVPSRYWTARDYFGIGTWAFWTTDGAQIGVGSQDLGYSWVVRDGDVIAASAPSTFVVIGMGILMLVYRRLRK